MDEHGILRTGTVTVRAACDTTNNTGVDAGWLRREAEGKRIAAVAASMGEAESSRPATAPTTPDRIKG